MNVSAEEAEAVVFQQIQALAQIAKDEGAALTQAAWGVVQPSRERSYWRMPLRGQ